MKHATTEHRPLWEPPTLTQIRVSAEVTAYVDIWDVSD